MLTGRKEPLSYGYRIYRSGSVELDSPRKWMLPPSSTTFPSLEEAKTSLNRQDRNLNRIGYTLATVAYLGGFAVLGGGLDMAFFHQLTNYDPAIQFGGLGIAVGAYASFASTVAYRMRVREQMHVINDVQDTSVTNLPLNQ